MYATTGSAAKFWGIWKEPQMEAEDRKFGKLQEFVNKPLGNRTLARIADTLNTNPVSLKTDRLVTEQDKAIYSLCRPDRLLELAWKFTVFVSFRLLVGKSIIQRL